MVGDKGKGDGGDSKPVEVVDSEMTEIDVSAIIQQNPLARDVMEKFTALKARAEWVKRLTNDSERKRNIWELANETAKKKWAKEDVESVIYFLGSDHGGKTSILNGFLSKEEVALESGTGIGLSYKFARRVNTQMETETCSFWELTGDARDWTNLINVPIRSPRLDFTRFTIFIILDLSELKSIWSVFEFVIKEIRITFKEVLTRMDRSKAVEISEKLDEKLGRRLATVLTEDRPYIDAIHLPICIICTKYDIFKNSEPETVKTVSRILRIGAHIAGASLFYYTKEDTILKRRFRELISHYGFGTAFPKETCYDNHLPLLIPHGGDSFEKIWPSQSPSAFNFDFCREHYESKIGIDNETSTDKISNSITSDERFAELIIDQQVAEHLAEIERDDRNNRRDQHHQ